MRPTREWVDESKHLPKPEREHLYLAVHLQFGVLDRHTVAAYNSLLELLRAADPQVKELEYISGSSHRHYLSPISEYVGQFIREYRVWCALNEST